MGSVIEWLARPGTKPESWNPVIGCWPMSAGCRYCYAAMMARRLEAMGQAKYAGTTRDGRFCGRIVEDPGELERPLRWRDPRTVFAVSMGDLFHPGVSPAFLIEIFAVVWLTPRHTYILVTKRPGRMRNEFGRAKFWRCVAQRAEEISGDRFTPRRLPLDNVWAIVSVEDQSTYERRFPLLMETPAVVRGISYEPMLAPIYPVWSADRPDWVIFGAESRGGRPGRASPRASYLVLLANRLHAFGVPVFVKQLHISGKLSKDPAEWPARLRRREWPDIRHLRKMGGRDDDLR